MRCSCRISTQPRSAFLGALPNRYASLRAKADTTWTLRQFQSKATYIKPDRPRTSSKLSGQTSLYSLLALHSRCLFERPSSKGGTRSYCKHWATGDTEGVLDRWNVSGMGSSNKGNEDQENGSLDERESKRVKLDAPVIPQEQIVKVSGFGNRALRSVLKGMSLVCPRAEHL